MVGYFHLFCYLVVVVLSVGAVARAAVVLVPVGLVIVVGHVVPGQFITIIAGRIIDA